MQRDGRQLDLFQRSPLPSRPLRPKRGLDAG
jgi:hypothetical protein